MKRILLLAALLLACLCVAAHAETTTVPIEFDYGQSEARAMLDMINSFRQGPDAWYWDYTDTNKVYVRCGPLVYDYELEKVAMLRAAEIAVSFDHTRPNGRSCFSVTQFGTQSYGENIAAGYTSAQRVFVGWQESNDPYTGQGHRRNMLNPGFTSVGIGHVKLGRYDYWVQEFSDSWGNAPTAAVDTTAVVSIEIDSGMITGCALKSKATEVSLPVSTEAELPEVTMELSVVNSWPYSTLKVPYTRAVTVADPGIIAATGTSIRGVGEGQTLLQWACVGQTLSMPVTVTHNYLTVVTPPTCTEDGFTTHTCVFCGDEKKDGFVTKLGHKYDKVVTPPTCTEDGFTTHTCARCGDSAKDSIVNKLGHNYKATVTQPTCTEDGFTGYTCARCGDVKKDTFVAKLGHNYSAVVTPPTCTEGGYTTHTCARCGDVYEDARVKALGHSVIKDAALAPTCVDTGLTEGSHCTVCAAVLVAQNTIPALGHRFNAEDICVVCGAKRIETLSIVAVGKNGTATIDIDSQLQLIPTFAKNNGWTVTGFKSSKVKAAPIDASGIVTAKATGSAKITITALDAAGKKKTATITLKVVDPYAPQKVAIDYGGIATIGLGESVSLKAVLTPSTAVSPLVWSTGKAKVATVDEEGVVTGRSVGKVKITVVTRNGKKATVKLNVVDPTIPAAVTISNGSKLTVSEGETLQLTAVVSPATADQAVTWTSAKPAVVAVDGEGRITALKPGKAKLTARTGNGKKATVTVTVTKGAALAGASADELFSAGEGLEIVPEAVVPPEDSVELPEDSTP